MGRKSSAKGHVPPQPPVPKASPKRSNLPLLIGAGIVALVAIGVLMLRPQSQPEPGQPPSAASRADSETTSGPAGAPARRVQQASPEAIARAEARAKVGPRRQQSLPPVPFQAYAPPRPHDVINAAYRFAAEHPEILSYVPCFCGCDHSSGHDGNHDCFVKERAPNGDVITWDEHGVECTVCIDVANRSRQLYASGASVRDIRAAIDKEFGSQASRQTPTPLPPSAASN
jgi:hypothetical protein